MFDVLVGITLLREGIALPEVSLVAVLDADKEGLLRSETYLVQTIGRAARNAQGKVILYADTITKSMRYAIDETNRRRAIQMKYNEENGITPQTIIKPVRDVIELRAKDEIAAASGRGKKAGKKKDTVPVSQAERDALITELTAEMKLAAKNLEFERAAYLRDRINEIKMASATSK